VTKDGCKRYFNCRLRANFINILSATLKPQIPKAQKYRKAIILSFALLGFGHLKAANKMLMKLTPSHVSGVVPIIR